MQCNGEVLIAASVIEKIGAQEGLLRLEDMEEKA